MRAIIQRVKKASVTISGKKIAAIENGLLILVGIESMDDSADIEWLAGKIVRMRIFPDAHGAMNNSLVDIVGEALVVSQFTLHASVKKGNRPSFMKAANPVISKPLYECFVNQLGELMQLPPKTGRFGEDMQVHLINDGPVTIILDSKNKE
ncbi:MAG: D-tyrosyl-tRNA(Tyr) deacylase [Crocinitomicaceae bacterium]|jgi:D-aminoacyl-tRNA deacylase|nr:D-tyrosyl-tRNA(Tyr) deacylase [Crocinitomicaceae bacterium]MBT5403950.1 D-tyrosyl-tRNA(Tyr) deacylase [Crocinitomicaceae bacterium]MBT6030220.1 D-tyrosyl-tRNA(Tyr) deacylase [Crocinitomicaceae bacterium]MBT6515340.1 D-tyrosyl-tRNA(Tyr) deacylase [Crocinitomicaceae bacterium]